MNNDVRDCVLGMVAGMRGEKRAARSKAVALLVSRLARARSLLMGSHLKRLREHHGAMKSHLSRLLHGPYADAEVRYKGLYNSDPLRPHNMSGRLGDLDVSPRPPLDPAKLSIADYTESERIRAALRPAADRLAMLEHRVRGLDSAVGATASRLSSEARAVHRARVAAVMAGAAGVGGVGYGLYKLLGDKEKK